MMGDQPIDLDQVHRTALAAYSAHQGFEAGVAVARCSNRALRRALDSSTDLRRTPVVLDHRIERAFGAHGLLVRSSHRTGRTLTLRLDRPGYEQLARAAAALVDAKEIDSTIECWCLEFVGNVPPLKVDTASVIAVAGLMTQPTEKQKPCLHAPLGLVPLLASNRLAAGVPPGQVAAEVTRLVLAQVIGEAYRLERLIAAGDRDATRSLRQDMELGRRALESAWRLLPGRRDPTFDMLPYILRSGARAAGGETDDQPCRPGLLRAALTQMMALHGRTPVAVVPWYEDHESAADA